MPLVLQTDRATHTLVVACLLGVRRRCGVLKWTRLQLLPLLAMLCCGCDQLAQNRTTPKAATTTPASATTALEIGTIESGNVTETHDIPFEILPYESTQVVARVEGYVQEIHVDIGDEVKAGQMLVLLSAAERMANIVHLQKKVAKAEVDRETSEATLTQAGSKREEQLALKRLNESKLSTTAGLVERGGLAEEQLDEARFSLESSEAALRRVDADVAAAEAQLKSAEAAIEVVKSELASALVWTEYLKIRAPFDGLITKRNVDHGDLVLPGVRQESALLTIDRVDHVKLVLYIGIENGTHVNVGDVVSVKSIEGRTDTNFPVQKVTRYARAFHRETRTVRVEVDIDNIRQDDATKRWFQPGEYGLASVTLNDYRDVTTVPASAVQADSDGLGTLLVGSASEARPVSVRILAGGQTTSDNRIAIEGIAESLKNGTQIIADFQQYRERQK